MQIEVTFDKDELEKMLKDLLARQGLKLAATDEAIRWVTRKGFRVVVKAEVNPEAAADLQAQHGDKAVPVRLPADDEEEDVPLDPSMFPDSASAEALQAATEGELHSQIPKIPGETAARQNKSVKKRQKRKPTRKDRGAGR